MSFREKLAAEAAELEAKRAMEEKVEIVEVFEAPPKVVFADGICNVCQGALFDHPLDKDGKKRDCNGWVLTFIDEPQAVVKAREDALKAQEAEAASVE